MDAESSKGKLMEMNDFFDILWRRLAQKSLTKISLNALIQEKDC